MANTYKFKNARLVDGKLYGLSMTTEREVSDGPKTDPNRVTTKVKFTIDYDGISLDQMMQYAGATLTIRRQNGVWKKQTPEQIKQDEDKIINWADMGKSGEPTKTPSIIVTLANIMINSGVSQDKAIERATKVANDPEKLAEMMKLVGMLDE